MDFELGKIAELEVVRKVDFGVYLSFSEEAAKEKKEVLLPIKQVPSGTEIGDRLSVFLYKDSMDRLIATTTVPKISLGKIAYLRVADITKIGAFLDWGLPKDLLLPYREQTFKVSKGDEIPVALYVDKTGRLCATMKLYPYLRTDGDFEKDENVSGYIYEISKNFGAFVIVDGGFSGLIPVKEMYGEIREGMKINARIISVKPDGKLDLTLRDKAYLMINGDADKLVTLMKERGGYFSFSDKADPELIRKETGMSKNEFKRAVGHLLKNGNIVISEGKIELK